MVLPPQTAFSRARPVQERATLSVFYQPQFLKELFGLSTFSTDPKAKENGSGMD